MDEDKPHAAKNKPKRKLPRKLSESYLRNAALYYLERHPCPVAHFITVMERKIARSAKAHGTENPENFTSYVRDKLVPDFIRAGYLNDTLYTRALTDSLQRKGLPKKAITYRLAAKGLEAEEEQLAAQNDLEAGLKFARRKRLGPFSKTVRDPRKDLAAMARAGFSYDIAQKVLKTDIETDPDQLP